MEKYKLKYLIYIFLALMAIQFVIGLVDILLSKADSDLTSITSLLISICSIPLSLINSKLPFFVSENLFMVLIYWAINLTIQSVFVYGVLLVIQKMKQSNK
ncbi:hypothetical protein [uncultured Winogradskyella sp.]|uniref:hypothetical protein n=1 Tax=uncultured Winogradskyella sp. TaxID=395353 RepID=UPI00263528A6|nr:hypothetical protein [uncultured Winogradskyella sp.]|tara:strand:+ start:746 stop:1048 length:303 start_codon:yes stop_codon:yes gene_type:complete